MYLEKTENSDKKEEKTVYVNIALVMPDKRQPRKKFDEAALAELAGSIKQYGIISPIIVREYEGFYQIIAGERRWRAARTAGATETATIKVTAQEGGGWQNAKSIFKTLFNCRILSIKRSSGNKLFQ